MTTRSDFGATCGGCEGNEATPVLRYSGPAGGIDRAAAGAGAVLASGECECSGSAADDSATAASCVFEVSTPRSRNQSSGGEGTPQTLAGASSSTPIWYSSLGLIGGWIERT